MGKYSTLDTLRVIFFRFFAAVGLAALLFIGGQCLSDVPKYVEKAALLLCFGGIF